MRRSAWPARVVVVVLAVSQLAAVAAPRPVERIPQAPAPEVSAPAWVLYDETNSVVLDGRAVDDPRPMASTTKIMTGLLAIESGEMQSRVFVSPRAADVGESEIGLVAGEWIPMEMLVNALLIRSANDAAVAVAEHLAGSVDAFVEQMNERARELGLESTSFANPHGLDAEGHHSSPGDLLTLAREAMRHDEFAEIIGTARFRLLDAPDGTVRVAEATNELLSTYRGTFGVKTGFTFQAGLVFVGGAERAGRRLWVVVMGAEGPGAHFADAARLLDHGFEDLLVVDTIARGTPFRIPSPDSDRRMLEVARLQTMLHVAALSPGLEATVEVSDDTVPSEVLTAELPGLMEAFGWLVSGLIDG